MAHSQKAHGQKAAMKQFNEGHWQKEHECPKPADGRYCEGEMENPMHLKKSVEGLAGYAKKHKMNYP
jgi:hypothetical protein